MRNTLLLLPLIFFGCEGQITVPPEPTVACDETAPASGPNLLRVTRAEFINAMHDVAGVTFTSTWGLPEDSRQGVLTVNGSAAIGLTDVQAYAAAAEEVAAQADLSQLVPCEPSALGEPECARRFISQLGRRAYRRPLFSDELQRFSSFFAEQSRKTDFNTAARLTLELVLHSPHFLFHIERTGTGQVDPIALASRLSFFLWERGPDDTLLDAAETGRLDSTEDISAQVRRMLQDSRASASIGRFHANLLDLDKEKMPSKNTEVHPNFNEALWHDMVDETTTFADYVVRKGDGRFSTLLTASYSFPQGGLSELYEVQPGQPNEPVAMNPAQRSGILTHASVMSTLANTDTSSPAKRGAIFLRNVVCLGIPDPPANAPRELPPISDGSMGPVMKTTRERTTALTGGADCSACHQFINGFGFAFENYDSIGKFRLTENDAPIDATGELRGTDVDGPHTGAVDLVQKLATSADTKSCYARQWLTFAMGRDDWPAIHCQAKSLVSKFAETDDIPTLLADIATHPLFLQAAPGSTP